MKSRKGFSTSFSFFGADIWHSGDEAAWAKNGWESCFAGNWAILTGLMEFSKRRMTRIRKTTALLSLLLFWFRRHEPKDLLNTLGFLFWCILHCGESPSSYCDIVIACMMHCVNVYNALLSWSTSHWTWSKTILMKVSLCQGGHSPWGPWPHHFEMWKEIKRGTST